MVHEKYIKISGKTYGPYYYESYREDGKIKKRYVKIPPKGLKSRVKNRAIDLRAGKIKILNRLAIFYIAIVSVLIIAVFLMYSAPFSVFENEIFQPELLLAPLGASVGWDGNANLSIWDDTNLGEDRYSGILVKFYANYTDTSGAVIDDMNGNCNIRYNVGGGYGASENMEYDSILLMWISNKTFYFKGDHTFEVDCTSNLGNIILENIFVISNSAPRIFKTPGGYVDIDGNPLNSDVLPCIEDNICVYNFSANVSDTDLNDVLNFGYIAGPNSTLTNFVLNSATGILNVNITKNGDTGPRRLELTATDSKPSTDIGILDIYITPVNDAPSFINLKDRSFNRSEIFEYYIMVNDEEDNIPFEFNITFINCSTAQWSTRGNTDCILFNETNYAINNTNYIEGNDSYIGASIDLSFTPSRNDVGNYVINFTVKDLNNNIAPYNNSLSFIVNFTVLNINEAPYLTYVCDNERNTSEDDNFECYINATDIDEINGLTFSSDKDWFLDLKTTPVNVTTGFNGSVKVEFSPTDISVGNWSINVSVNDTGSPTGEDSREFWFFVNNKNDSVYLGNLGSVDAYTSNNNLKIYINASDNDLLIPDKSVYDEKLVFASNYSNCVNITSEGVITGTNITSALIEFNPSNPACFNGGAIYRVNISVRDANNYSVDSNILTINILGNSAPQWQNPPTPNILTEDINFYLNLSQYVTDANGDSINFSFISDTSFFSFDVNAFTGVINFTPDDLDIGQHIVTINASDGKTPSPYVFNFTVLNVNDNPSIIFPFRDGYNFTINANNSDYEVMEDDTVEFQLFVIDDDLKIPDGQKGFYNENININFGIVANTTLFDFVRDYSFPGPGDENRVLFRAVFIPRKSDVGYYNVSINISDASSVSLFMILNLTVFEINHRPVFINLSDQATTINRALYYDINAEDLEDGNDSSGNLTYSYTFLNGIDFINHDESIFNTSSGILNIIFGNGQGGDYHINLSVNDSMGATSYEDFWIYVFDIPQIIFPSANYVFNLKEGNATNLTFIANSTRLTNLSYFIYINNDLRYNISYYGNSTKLIWRAVPKYTDETYGLFGNLTLTVGILGFEFLNNSMTWDANISHGNAPLSFINNIGERQGIYGKPIIINLSEYFSDVDAFDPYYNQNTTFAVKSNANLSAITLSLDGWILSLNAGGPVAEILNITGSDLDGNRSVLTSSISDNFKIKFEEPLIVPEPVPVPVPVSGGGGGATEKPVSLRIILPGPVSAKKGEVVIVPIEIVNEGFTTLNKISLSTLIAKDGKKRDDINVSLSKNFIESLSIGERENLTITIQRIEGELGMFELTIDAVVSNPDYKDRGKIFINFEEGETIIERLIFTEEFIVENPECIELKELLNETRKFIDAGDFKSAEEKLNEVIDACRDAISKQSFFSKDRLKAKFEDKIFLYLIIATIMAIVFGVGYYVYQIRMLKKASKDAFKVSEDNTKKV